mmetsp:Transcript_9600/g.23801  ORF Transcript_9600/g.23801 Transcript_9600/m.23801 type:complete len:217 (-) Transcript_9600:493-1143(-)
MQVVAEVVHLVLEVAVREHHAARVARGARRVHDGGHVRRLALGRVEGRVRHARAAACHQRLPSHHLCGGTRALGVRGQRGGGRHIGLPPHGNDEPQHRLVRLEQHGQQARQRLRVLHHEPRAARVRQDVAQLVDGRGGAAHGGHAARRHHTLVRHDPPARRLGQQRHRLAGPQPQGSQARPSSQHQRLHLRIRQVRRTWPVRVIAGHLVRVLGCQA